jgi:carboxymethylenebutenolidase
VPWYGHVTRTFRTRPASTRSASRAASRCPSSGSYGLADPGIPAEDEKRFEAELRKTNRNVEFVLCPGAAHAFFSDDRPQAYRKDAAEDGGKRCVAFFDEHLKS